jgi:hypothetical protein
MRCITYIQILGYVSGKCEPPDSPVKFFANQHKLSCVSSIHARINQKITKTAIGPKFPWRPDVTVVAYPPIIDAKPNDMATVHTAMKKWLDMTNEAGQEHAIQTFDQQLYAIAQQVKWSKRKESSVQ